MEKSIQLTIVVSKEAQAAIDLIKSSPVMYGALLADPKKVSPLFDSETTASQVVLTPSRPLVEFIASFVQAPAWDAFLKDIFTGDDEVISQAQCLFGQGVNPTKEEARAILELLIKGCLGYRVESAESLIQDFIGARCVKADGVRELFGDLYRAYLDWHDANMVTRPMLKKRFMEIVGRQFKIYRAGGSTFVNGLKLKDSELVPEGL